MVLNSCYIGENCEMNPDQIIMETDCTYFCVLLLVHLLIVHDHPGDEKVFNVLGSLEERSNYLTAVQLKQPKRNQLHTQKKTNKKNSEVIA